MYLYRSVRSDWLTYVYVLGSNRFKTDLFFLGGRLRSVKPLDFSSLDLRTKTQFKRYVVLDGISDIIDGDTQSTYMDGVPETRLNVPNKSGHPTPPVRCTQRHVTEMEKEEEVVLLAGQDLDPVPTKKKKNRIQGSTLPYLLDLTFRLGITWV